MKVKSMVVLMGIVLVVVSMVVSMAIWMAVLSVYFSEILKVVLLDFCWETLTAAMMASA